MVDGTHSSSSGEVLHLHDTRAVVAAGPRGVEVHYLYVAEISFLLLFAVAVAAR